MEEQSTEWQCPNCGKDLIEVGFFEVVENVDIWTKWEKYGERWDVKDEEHGDSRGWYLECGECQVRLSSEMSHGLWDCTVDL